MLTCKQILELQHLHHRWQSGIKMQVRCFLSLCNSGMHHLNETDMKKRREEVHTFQFISWVNNSESVAIWDVEIFAWVRWQKLTHADNRSRRFKGMWTRTAGLLTPWEVSSTWPIVATVLRATSSLGLCQGFPLILIMSIIFWASHSQEDGSLESPIYFLQMMWFCWGHLVVICSSRWHRRAECRAAGMRISFSSVYSRSRISFRTNQFKLLRKLFMNEGRD